MVFRLFARKQDDVPEPNANDRNARLPTPTPSIASIAHHSPLRFPTIFNAVLGGSTTDSTFDPAAESVAEGGNNVHSSALPVTPSPVSPDETKALYDLMLTIPPKTLHAYTLAHLRPQPPPPSSPVSPTLGLHPDSTPRPPSPNTVSKLISFFSTLAPPPLLHCVRCHKDFYNIENEEKDKACRVPHDDESATVLRLPAAGYETLWGCCGQTASGDGSEGPPDGWCYEGRHTTDAKRARFRADSTIHDDKLTSCLKLHCHGIRDQLPRRYSHASPSHNVGGSPTRKSNPSPARSQASVLIPRSTRKRQRKSFKEASGSEDEADAESSLGRVAMTKGKGKVGDGAGEGDGDTSMSILSLKAKGTVKSRPISRARLPPSTFTTVSFPSGSSVTPVVALKAKTAAAKPKSTSHTLLSQSHTQPLSDSEASTRSRPRTRSLVREESRSRASPKLTKADISEQARRARTRRAAYPFLQPLLSKEEHAETNEYQESNQEERGRDRKKRRIGRN